MMKLAIFSMFVLATLIVQYEALPIEYDAFEVQETRGGTSKGLPWIRERRGTSKGLPWIRGSQ